MRFPLMRGQESTTRPILHYPDPCGPSCVAKPMESKSRIGFEHDDCLDVEPVRSARCTCGKTAPFSPSLTYFEDLGPGSRNATEGCICGLNREVHAEAGARARPHIVWHFEKCGGVFQPRGAMPFDLFFCGHGD